MTRTEHNAADHSAADHDAADHNAPGRSAVQPGADDMTGQQVRERVPQPGPWSVRIAPRRHGRAALEVYEHGALLDVMVASALSDGLLRGARRCVLGGRSTGFAWGRLPPDKALPTVTFTGSRLSRLMQPAQVVPLAGEFWLAWAEGPCGGVLVRHGDGSPIRLRARRA